MIDSTQSRPPPSGPSVLQDVHAAESPERDLRRPLLLCAPAPALPPGVAILVLRADPITELESGDL
jgi:hypothetical protein